MFEAIWSFLRDSVNQEPLKMIGGTAVALATGIFTVYKLKKSDSSTRSPPSNRNEFSDNVSDHSTENNIATNKAIITKENINSPINIS